MGGGGVAASTVYSGLLGERAVLSLVAGLNCEVAAHLHRALALSAIYFSSRGGEAKRGNNTAIRKKGERSGAKRSAGQNSL